MGELRKGTPSAELDGPFSLQERESGSTLRPPGASHPPARPDSDRLPVAASGQQTPVLGPERDNDNGPRGPRA